MYSATIVTRIMYSSVLSTVVSIVLFATSSSCRWKGDYGNEPRHSMGDERRLQVRYPLHEP